MSWPFRMAIKDKAEFQGSVETEHWTRSARYSFARFSTLSGSRLLLDNILLGGFDGLGFAGDWLFGDWFGWHGVSPQRLECNVYFRRPHSHQYGMPSL